MFVLTHIYFDELISIAVSDRKSIPIQAILVHRRRSSSRISIQVRVVDERAAERRGNVGTSTYTGAVLIRGFSLRKASMRTIHEYEQTDAPRREKIRGWRLSPETREKDKRGRAMVLASFSPGVSKDELT